MVKCALILMEAEQPCRIQRRTANFPASLLYLLPPGVLSLSERCQDGIPSAPHEAAGECPSNLFGNDLRRIEVGRDSRRAVRVADELPLGPNMGTRRSASLPPGGVRSAFLETNGGCHNGLGGYPRQAGGCPGAPGFHHRASGGFPEAVIFHPEGPSGCPGAGGGCHRKPGVRPEAASGCRSVLFLDDLRPSGRASRRVMDRWAATFSPPPGGRRATPVRIPRNRRVGVLVRASEYNWSAYDTIQEVVLPVPHPQPAAVCVGKLSARQ